MINLKHMCACFLFVLSLSAPVYAHPGKTDANGGHWDKSTGQYHYHDGTSSGRTQIGSVSPNQTNPPAAETPELFTETPILPAPSPSAAPQIKSSYVQINAALLVFLISAPILTVIAMYFYTKNKISQSYSDAQKLVKSSIESKKNIIGEKEELKKNFYIQLKKTEIERDEYLQKYSDSLKETESARNRFNKEKQKLEKELSAEKKKCSECEDRNNCIKYKAAIADFKSNLTAFPYMSGIVADLETYGIEVLAAKLDWGYSSERLKKVKAIREIRRDAKLMIQRNKESQYQLAYLLQLMPSLSDIIDCDFRDLPAVEVKDFADYDTARDYLTKDEYKKLSVAERNQLALDRYNDSHSKSKWQIGRDYELYIGHKYFLKGYKIDYFGSYMGLEDLGRDLIAKKDDKTLIIQCKYWSSKKNIHEKHITQLYGTLVSYCIENNLPHDSVKGVLVTNTELSSMARKMAAYLKIDYAENFQKGQYPCIKCNINKSTGERIYHLPFDQQYDNTKIEDPGEFYAMTVAEAESAGFRRAFRWNGV